MTSPSFKVHDAGKGFYIRALVRDIGGRPWARKAMSGASAAPRVGAFTEAESVTLDELQLLGQKGAASERLKPVETALDDIPALAINGEDAFKLRQGRPIVLLPHVVETLKPQFRDRFIGGVDASRAAIALYEGKAVALGDVRAGALSPWGRGNSGACTLTLETGKIARQADGAVMATYGETACSRPSSTRKEAKPGQDFFPLTVNYQEKTFAAGKIPGGFFKREGRPTEKETLVSRLIDRPIRPLFAEGFKNEVQVIGTVLSHDLENDPDIVGDGRASAALTISGVPFMGPIGAARVGYIDGAYIMNPTIEQMEDVQARPRRRRHHRRRADGRVRSQELSEDDMLGAVMFGHKGFQPVIDAIIELAEVAAKEPFEFEPDQVRAGKPRSIWPSARSPRRLQDHRKQANATTPSAPREKAKAALGRPRTRTAPKQIRGCSRNFKAEAIVRCDILRTPARIDGRDPTGPPIVAEVGVLPRTHGSALFTRGETQALCVATLGTAEDEQIIDALEGTTASVHAALQLPALLGR
jgi:polyribonucleotide nucleotidyltransferase